VLPEVEIFHVADGGFPAVYLSLILAGRNKNPTPPTKHMRPSGPSLSQGIGPAGRPSEAKAIVTKKMPERRSRIPNNRYHLFLVKFMG
jgi:hypothetical protein